MVSETALEELCDENGFLRQGEAWSQDVAEAFAATEGVILTAAHWEVLSCFTSFSKPSATPPRIEHW